MMARHGLLALAAVLVAANAAAGAPDLFFDYDNVDADYEDTQQPREGRSSPLLVSALEDAAEIAKLSAAEMALQWADFKVAHGKSYETLDEEAARMRVFADNLQYINEHNARYDNGETTYYMGVNHLADLTTDEIAAFYLGNLPLAELNNMPKIHESELANMTAPSSLDWREKNLVTPVKNQARCGSCWAFAATGALEGAHAKKSGRLQSYSEQQLVDCAGGRYHNQGCNGGWPHRAIAYVRDNGIATEEAYPYTAKDGQCHYESSMKAAGATGYKKSPRRALTKTVAAFGPLAVALDAGQRSFGFYKGGVYYDRRCRMYHHNHAVTLVGYTSEYWLLKNSWSENWGEQGYMKMSRRGTACGVTVHAYAATV